MAHDTGTSLPLPAGAAPEEGIRVRTVARFRVDLVNYHLTPSQEG